MTKILPWLAFLFSVILAWSVFTMARKQEPLGPRQILEQVQGDLERGELTRQDAIRELDRAIELAREKTRPNLLADLYTARGQVYFGMNGLTKASEDFERVIDIYRPGDRLVENSLVDVDIAAGNFESAQARLQGILRNHPEDPYAWTRSGKLGMLAGDAIVRQCQAWIDDALVPDDAAAARELILSIAARHPRDPSRVALIQEIRAMFPNDDGELVRRILDAADEASQSYRQARTATATAIKYEVSAESATQLMHLFQAADRHEEVVEIGQLLLKSASDGAPAGTVVLPEETSFVMLESLRELERYQPASRIVAPWMRRSMTIHSPEFYRAACRALYEAESWVNLVPLAGMMRMRGFDEDTTRFANLFQGVGLVERGGMDELAIYALSRFLNGLDHDIFPGSRVIGFEAKAKAQRAMGDPAELESLLGVYALDQECSGEINLRISDLMRNTPNRGPTPPLIHLTHAMRKMPERNAELFPLWVEIGEKEISTSAVNMDLVFERLKESKQWVQSRGATPYRLWRFGEMYREEQEWVGMNAIAKRVLIEYPDFVPALDQRIDAEIGLGHELVASDLILERIELTGLDERAREWLARVPSMESSGGRILRMMRADPENTGRLILARTIAEGGDADGALRFLRGLATEPTDEQLALITELQLELGRRAAALKSIQTLKERGAQGDVIRGLTIAATLEGADLAELEDLATDLLERAETTHDELIGMVERLIARGHYDLALRILDGMDERPELRSGEVLMHYVMIHMLEDRLEEVDPYLERAEAFDAAGGPELAQIFLDLEYREWTKLSTHVRALRQSRYRESELVSAILDLLAEDLDGALARLAEVPEARINGDGWQIVRAACDVFGSKEIEQPPFLGTKRPRDLERLVRGSVEEKRDPRQALGLLLALETRAWLPWAEKKIAQLDTEVVGPLWPIYFQARAKILRGEYFDAEETLEGVHSLRPDFGPAWALHEQVRAATLRSEDHPDILRLRLRRAEAMGQSAANQRDVALASVIRAFDDADYELAEELALKLVSEYPRWPLGHAKLAEIYTKTNRFKKAFLAYAEACLSSTPAPNLPYVPRLFNALPAAQRGRNRISTEEVATLLEDLARHLPKDPVLALRLARLDIEDEPIDPTIGVDRAFARLERFVAETPRSLEELRPRSTRQWIEFYNEIDPERAAAFLESELLRRPGDLELWILHSQVLRANGNLGDAIEHCEVMKTMANDSRILRELAVLRAATGSNISEVDSLVTKIVQLEQLKGLDSQLVLVKVQGLLNSGNVVTPQVLNLLAHLWKNRRWGEQYVRQGELARIYVNSLLGRGKPEDYVNAQTVIEVLLKERQANWYEIPYFNAMLGVTKNVPEADEIALNDAGARPVRAHRGNAQASNATEPGPGRVRDASAQREAAANAEAERE